MLPGTVRLSIAWHWGRGPGTFPGCAASRTERMLNSSSRAVVRLVRSRRFATAQTTATQWPPTLRAFVEGTPIITRKLPLVGRVEIDFGTSMLNYVDPTILNDRSAMTSGIMKPQRDATRRPRQINAMACCGFV